MSKQVVIIGGGAAGIFCAVNLAKRSPGVKVIVVEKTNKLLSKVKVSGGGRCNVTHACFDISEMITRYPRGTHFVRKAFHHFFTTDTIEWFQARGVKLKTESDGRMFPVTNSSQTIIDCLLQEASDYGVEFKMQAEVIRIQQEENKFHLLFKNNEALQADLLCVACGGYPKSSQFEWLKESGHSIEEPVPSLFTFNIPKHPITELMGLSVELASVKIAGTKLQQQGPLLITHWGLSGPAVLKTSAWGARILQEKNWHFTAMVNWLNDVTEQQLLQRWPELRLQLAAQKITNRNPFQLPQRLWDFLLQQAQVKPDIRWADLPSREQNKLIKLLVNSEFEVKGKTTFKEEFVTAGGIKLSEVDPSTMMSRKTSGLHFAGEILDVDGVTGGFNFQHAWTSGWIAAKHMGEQLQAIQ